MTDKLTQRFVVTAMVGYVTFGVFRYSIAVVLDEIQALFGLTEAQTGGVMSSLLLACLLTMNFASPLVARVGKRVVIAIGIALSSFGSLFFGFANSYHASVGATFLSGLGAGLLAPSIYGLMGEVLPKSRGFVAGLTNGMYVSIGGFVGPFLSGILIDRFDWRFPFYVFSVISFLTLVFFSFLSKDLPVKYQGGVGDEKLSFKALSSRQVLIASASMFAAYFGFIALFTWAPSFLLRVRELGVVQTGTIFGILALMGGVGSIVLGWLSDRCDRRSVILGAASMTVAAAVLFFYYPLTSAMIVMLSVLLGFASSAFWSLIISLAQDAVDPLAIVSVTGLIQSIGLIAGIVSPIVSAWLINDAGFQTALITCVCIPFLIHGALILLAKANRQACVRSS